MSDALSPPDFCMLCSLCLEDCSTMVTPIILEVFAYTLLLWETIFVHGQERLDALALSPHPAPAPCTSHGTVVHPAPLAHGFPFHSLRYPVNAV